MLLAQCGDIRRVADLVEKVDCSGDLHVLLTKHLDRNLDIAAVDVQNRASTALGRLPVEVQTTGLGINKNSGSWVLAAAFVAELRAGLDNR